MRPLIGLFRIGRPVNVLITLSTVVAAAYLLETVPGINRILVAAVGAALIAGFGNTINDIFDREIDAVNRPNRPIPSGAVTLTEAKLFAIIYAASGLAAAAVASLECLLIALLAAVILSFYAAVGKRTLVISNLTVAFVSALTFVYPAGIRSEWSFSELRFALLGALFAFLFHLAREVVKDIEDMQGDSQLGSRTMPIVFGVPSAKSAAVSVFCILAISMVAVHVLYELSTYYLLAAISLTILPVVAVSILLIRSQKPAEYGVVQATLKALMPLGLIVLLIGRWTV